MGNPPSSQQPTAYGRIEKRFGWFMLYEDFIGNSKWLVVEQKSEVPLVEVHAIVLAMLVAASKARAEGWLCKFDVDECALALKVPREHVAGVYRTLVDMGWIIDDHIVDWPKLQPGHGSAEKRQQWAERQRTKRARDAVAKRVDLGLARPEEVAALEQLREMSRVTAAQNAPPRPVTVLKAFEQVACTNLDRDAVLLAERANQAAARIWLFGNGEATDFGIATHIVSEMWGVKPLSAAWKIGRWAERLDAVVLARIISECFERDLNRFIFRTTVEAAIERAANEQAEGAQLAFGPGRRTITGGAA